MGTYIFAVSTSRTDLDELLANVPSGTQDRLNDVRGTEPNPSDEVLDRIFADPDLCRLDDMNLSGFGKLSIEAAALIMRFGLEPTGDSTCDQSRITLILGLQRVEVPSIARKAITSLKWG